LGEALQILNNPGPNTGVMLIVGVPDPKKMPESFQITEKVLKRACSSLPVGTTAEYTNLHQHHRPTNLLTSQP